MALAPIVSAQDGARVTVNDLVKAPRVIPQRILDMTQNQFIVDSVLRDGGSIPGGVAEFYQSTPLFANIGSAIKEEFGEYRIATTSLGIPSIVASVNRGLSIKVSEEMRRRNQIDRVNIQMTQVRNTLVRDWEMAFQTATVGNASIPVVVAGNAFGASSPTLHPWDGSDSSHTPTIRVDILEAKRVVNQAVSPVQPVDSNGVAGYLNFQPDTLIINSGAVNNVLKDPTFNAPYVGNIASENVLYTGKLPNQLLDLDVLTSRTWPANKVMVCERSTLGFISDERPMQATPLYEDQPTETWRSDVSRISAIGIDQPLAACIIQIA